MTGVQLRSLTSLLRPARRRGYLLLACGPTLAKHASTPSRCFPVSSSFVVPHHATSSFVVVQTPCCFLLLILFFFFFFVLSPFHARCRSPGTRTKSAQGDHTIYTRSRSRYRYSREFRATDLERWRSHSHIPVTILSVSSLLASLG